LFYTFQKLTVNKSTFPGCSTTGQLSSFSLTSGRYDATVKFSRTSKYFEVSDVQEPMSHFYIYLG